jgi:shikimate dehydrogenase
LRGSGVELAVVEGGVEAAFREKEACAIAALAREPGRVISTGGGAILRKENIRALRRTGRLLFLDRPLDRIRPTKDRPTASDREALARRFAERYPIYRKTADCRIDASLGIEAVTAAGFDAFLGAVNTQGETE